MSGVSTQTARSGKCYLHRLVEALRPKSTRLELALCEPFDRHYTPRVSKGQCKRERHCVYVPQCDTLLANFRLVSSVEQIKVMLQGALLKD